jgi:hypothetical protein
MAAVASRVSELRQSVATANVTFLPFGNEIAWTGKFRFPQWLITGPVCLTDCARQMGGGSADEGTTPV